MAMKRKFIDENGRLFGLVSIVDVLAVAVIAVLVVAFTSKQSSSAIITAVAPMDEITYEVYVENMPDGRLEALRVGDNLYDNDTTSFMGVIEKIDRSCDGNSSKTATPKSIYATAAIAARRMVRTMRFFLLAPKL